MAGCHRRPLGVNLLSPPLGGKLTCTFTVPLGYFIHHVWFRAPSSGLPCLTPTFTLTHRLTLACTHAHTPTPTLPPSHTHPRCGRSESFTQNAHPSWLWTGLAMFSEDPDLWPPASWLLCSGGDPAPTIGA